MKQEIIELRPWYDQAFKQRGRTTAGVSGLDSEDKMMQLVCKTLLVPIAQVKSEDE